MDYDQPSPFCYAYENTSGDVQVAFPLLVNNENTYRIDLIIARDPGQVDIQNESVPLGTTVNGFYVPTTLTSDLDSHQYEVRARILNSNFDIECEHTTLDYLNGTGGGGTDPTPIIAQFTGINLAIMIAIVIVMSFRFRGV